MLRLGEVKTLKDIIIKKCTEYYQNVAFLEKDNNNSYEKITYEKLQSDVINLATALNEKYKLANKKIAIIGENSYSWYMSYMAVTTGVGIVVPLDKELPESEILNLIKRAKVGCIIFSHKKRDAILNIVKTMQQNIICIDMGTSDVLNAEKSLYLENVLLEGEKLRNNGSKVYENHMIEPEEFRILLFTSGTTANSKGVMLSHKNVIANIEGAIDVMKIDTKDRFFSVLPMHHVYESIVTCMYGISNGASIAICSSLKNFAADIKQAKPTVLVGVPLLLEHVKQRIYKTIEESNKTKLVNSMITLTNKCGKIGRVAKKIVFKKIHMALGGRLKYILVSAAPVPIDLINTYEGLGYIIFQGYGLSEAAPLVSATRIKTRTAGTVGQASNCIVKIENNKQGEIGEILVKGPNIMLGYYEDKEATEKTLVDGWLHTGDLGYIDNKNNLILTGRCKSVIVTPNGKNIYPEELEEQIDLFAEISESLVYGEEENNDTILTAVVTLNKEFIQNKLHLDLKGKKIRDIIWEKIKELNKKMVPYKAIKRVKIRLQDFEKTTTMKIKRFAKNNKEGEQ